MGIFAQQFGHGFYHGMFDRMSCGWNSFGWNPFGWNPFGCWNQMPMFFTPNCMSWNFFQHPSVMNYSFFPNHFGMTNFLTPSFTPTPVPTYQSAVFGINNGINTFSTHTYNDNTLGTTYSSGNIDTFVKTSAPVKQSKQTSSISSKTVKHWSKMTDEELLQVYGDYTRDITKPYGGDANTLNKYLKNKGVLADKGQAFMKAQEDYGISAAVLVAICVNESGNGKSKLAKTKNNIGGIRNTGSNEFRSFNKVEDCIDFMAKLLKNNYVNNSGRPLTKLYQVNAKYCPASDPTDKSGKNSYWAKAVDKLAAEVENFA